MSLEVYEFDEFRLDSGRFELYRSGQILKLEKKPMELLILLAASDGQLLTRTQIAESLWERNVFVDTEHGINTAIRKIRRTLRDDPEQPRFVQTVSGKGYRFVPSVKIRRALIETENPAAFLPGPGPECPPDNTSRFPREVEEPHSRFPHGIAFLEAGFALAIVIVLALRVTGNFLTKAGPNIGSVAVLPLVNLSAEPGQDYLADGITDELTTLLTKNSTLRVVSRTSVMQYKGVHRPLPEIARELGVDGVVEGSVARTGEAVHVTVQLIEARNDTHIWAESYDRHAEDVVSLPQEAAQTIAKQLHRATVHPAVAHFVRPEAHDAYLRGEYLWVQQQFNEAGGHFRKAIELQPDYAQGWSGLANYYGGSTITGEMNPKESLGPQEAAALHAVALDDELPEAHLALSAAEFCHWNWARAEREAVRAIELNPRYAEAYHFRAKILASLNRHQEALASQKIATELDPFSKPWAMAMALREARQYDAANSELRLRLEGDPLSTSLLWPLYDLYRRRGLENEAAKFMESQLVNQGNKVAAASVKRAFQGGGYKAVLRWQLASLVKESSTRYVSPYDLALLNARLKRGEKTLSLLEQSCQERSPALVNVQNDPAFDFVHSDERYRAIIKEMGLPPSY